MGGWVRRSGLAALVVGAALVAGAAAPTFEPPPPALAWAYGIAPEGAGMPKLGPGPFKAPDGRLLTPAQVEALTAKDSDWYPGEHPAAPVAVFTESKDRPEPCASCHMANGEGFGDVADVAGLPAGYIREQLHAFHAGERLTAEPRDHANKAMVWVTGGWPQADLDAAADYFAATPRRARLKVVESDVAPATAVTKYGWTYAVPGPPQTLEGRIVEVPDSLAAAYLGDAHAGATVYVPRGSLARGAAVARTGGGGGLPCAACHGPGLRGLGDVPSLAGRGPGYIARQLWDIRSGARGGVSVALMQTPAKGLSPRQITDVAAYLASLKP